METGELNGLEMGDEASAAQDLPAPPRADDAPGDIEDLAEVEVGGRRHLIPKALKGGFLMQADYTRKTQALAAERAALEAERAALRVAGPAGAEVDGPQAVALAAIDDLVGRYQQVDWQGLAAANPQAAREAWDAFANAAAEREALAQHLAVEGQARALENAQERQKALQAGHAELARDVPGWSPQLAGEMNRFAQAQFGFTPDEVGSVTDPRLVKLLHKAFSGAADQARAARIRAGQATQPAYSLRGGGGAFHAAGNTDDFAAFERLADAKLKAR